MAVITIDGTWDRVRWTADGRTIRTASSIRAIADQLNESHAFVCEPSFYDGLRDVRDAIRELLARDGHRLAPVNPGAKAVLETAAGDRVVGTGLVRLHSIAVAGSAGIDWQVGRGHQLWDVRDALDVVHAIDLVDDTARIMALALAVIGPYADLDAGARLALGDGQTYRRDVLLAAYRAASVATNRDDFERFLGLTAGPSGSALAHTIRSWYATRNTTSTFERDSVLTWSQYRRALRLCFQRVTSARRHPSSAAA